MAIESRNIGLLKKLYALLIALFSMAIAGSSAQAQTEDKTRTAAITIGGLNILIRASDQHSMTTLASQLNLLQNLDRGGEVVASPEVATLLIFAGNDLFIQDRLTDQYLDFDGVGFVQRLSQVRQGQSPCSQELLLTTVPGNMLLHTIDTSQLDDLATNECIAKAMISPWSNVQGERMEYTFANYVLTLIDRVTTTP
ncbi:hypothetical protein [Yoonia sp. BS5-3]|uniref:Uncharacterized protein n=1 Tax=Yoonia phaeophyticola TaxID=3137369 RepID=A0ABZ2V3B6_9RHOB